METFIQYIPVIAGLVLFWAFLLPMFQGANGKFGNLFRSGVMSMRTGWVGILVFLVLYIIFNKLVILVLSVILGLILPASIGTIGVQAISFIAQVFAVIGGATASILALGWWNTIKR